MGKSARIAYLSGEITEDSTANLSHRILELELNSNSPILLYINSTGGNVRQSLALHDLIKSSNCDIIGVVVGNCYSAANLVLQACKERYATPYSEFMLHYGTGGIGEVPMQEFVENFRAEIKNSELVDELVLARVSKPKQIKKAIRTGRFMFANEAKDLGLIDAVIKQRTVG